MSDKLPPVIVGALPSPKRLEREYVHRVKHTHFTPDGKIVECTCGWQSHLCGSEEQYEIEWLEHLHD